VKWDRRNSRDSGLESGGARPSAEIRWQKTLLLHGEADLLGADTPDHVAEAWAGWAPSDFFRLRAGLLRVPLGTEFATPEPDLPLVGWSFSSYLDGRTDVAARLEADPLDGAIRAEATWAFGNGFRPDGTEISAPQGSLRAAARPGRLLGAGEWLDGWYAGAAYAHLTEFEDPLVLQNPLRNTVFRTSDLDGNGGRWLHLETGYARGRLAAGLEVVRGEASGVSRSAGGSIDMDQLTAWTATAAFSLTGADREWKGGAWTAPTPRGPGGSWELALRYSNGDMDRSLFDQGYTTYNPSTQEVRSFSALLAWRPWKGVRFATGWVKTIADDSLSVFGFPGGRSSVPRQGNDDRDSSYVFRVEVAF